MKTGLDKGTRQDINATLLVLLPPSSTGTKPFIRQLVPSPADEDGDEQSERRSIDEGGVGESTGDGEIGGVEDVEKHNALEGSEARTDDTLEETMPGVESRLLHLERCLDSAVRSMERPTSENSVASEIARAVGPSSLILLSALLGGLSEAVCSRPVEMIALVVPLVFPPSGEWDADKWLCEDRGLDSCWGQGCRVRLARSFRANLCPGDDDRATSPTPSSLCAKQAFGRKPPLW